MQWTQICIFATMNKLNIAGQSVIRFADIEVLRYQIDGFEALPLKRKLLVYHLSQATLAGRDIIFDQNGRYNLRIRHILETIYTHYEGARETDEFVALEEYLYRVWFASGIHHHYGCDKFIPNFSQSYLSGIVEGLQREHALLLEYSEDELADIYAEIFDPTRSPKSTEQSGEADLVEASSVNFYDRGVGQKAVEAYYQALQDEADEDERQAPPSYGLNSRIAQTADGTLYEQVYKQGGLYGEALYRISAHLKDALEYVDTEMQSEAIKSLLAYYRTGNLKHYNDFCIKWVQDTAVSVDFINGFTEVYADPLGLKGSWEGLVHIKNPIASERTDKICREAKWFEEHAPIDDRFKKAEPKGISASVVTVAMLGGDSYPATPIGINLPNADWIRAEYGSKSVTIDNIHAAYREASRHNGMDAAFIADAEVRALLERYDGLTDELHTDLHECLGHGSGQLCPGVSPDALGAYASVNEEARADLFALYYMADEHLLELGLLPDADAYKACYYRYLLNGLVTQLVRIPLGANIEEAHMRNRALIARYALERGKQEGTIELNGLDLKITNYEALRGYFADLLREVQRMKSEGDFAACKQMVERYAVHIDTDLHEEVLKRYKALNLAPYKGFVNPKMTLRYEGEAIVDVELDYTEAYAEQMLRYSREYWTLPLNPVQEERLRDPRPSAKTLEKAKELRAKLRHSMDGVISTSMRDKGLDYGINFGLTMEFIVRLAKELGEDGLLASYLLSRDVRELQLIGQQIYPASCLNFSIATALAERSMPNPELRDCLCKHLFDRNTMLPQYALAWLTQARYKDLSTIAYTTLARHFTFGYKFAHKSWEQCLLRCAFKTLDEDAPYMTSEQRAALLMLKRWGRSDKDIQAQILQAPEFVRWETSGSCLFGEYVDDIKFEFSYEG